MFKLLKKSKTAASIIFVILFFSYSVGSIFCLIFSPSTLRVVMGIIYIPFSIFFGISALVFFFLAREEKRDKSQ